MTTKTKEQAPAAVAEDLQPKALATKTAAPVAQYEDTGFEDFTQQDLAVPFLVLLQKNSPQVEDGNPKRVPNAKAGDFMNSVTGDVYDGKAGIAVVPVHRLHNYIEWIPRDDGGGLVAVFAHDAPEVAAALKASGNKRFGKIKVNDNNDLVQTFNVFALHVLPDGRVRHVVLGFSSSQIGAYQKWMTNAMEQTHEVAPGAKAPYPMWSHRYRITTAFFQNKKGSWHKMSVAFDGADAEAARYADSDPLQRTAKEFRAMLLSGAAQANFESAAQDATSSEENQYEL